MCYFSPWTARAFFVFLLIRIVILALLPGLHLLPLSFLQHMPGARIEDGAYLQEAGRCMTGPSVTASVNKPMEIQSLISQEGSQNGK